MYKMLWAPLACGVVATAAYFCFMQGQLPITWLYAAVSSTLIGCGVVLSNKETSIEQPRYGLAILFSMAAVLLVLIPWVVLKDTIK